MSAETMNQKGCVGIVGDAKTPVNIERNSNAERTMTRNEIYDQPETPLLQSGGVFWFEVGAGFLNTNKTIGGLR